jgi:signal transduction histidine kinase
VLLVLLLIVVGVLFVVDRVAANVAEGQIAQQTKKELAARQVTINGDPKVAIAGFPFLTQVVAGKYKKITIDMDQPKVNNVQLSKLEVVASTVHADARSVMNGTGNVVADAITGTATISWDNVRPLLQLAGLPSGIDVSQVDLQVNNNQAQIKIPLESNGFKFNLIAKGTLIVQSGAVLIRLDDVSSDQGQAPQVVKNLIKQYQKQLTARIRIPDMPFSLVINKVQTTDAGLLMIATASHVTLAGSQ